MATIIIGFFFLLAMVASWIDWQKYIEKFWGNSPAKARVYIEADEQVECVNAKLLYSDAKRGLIYEYKWNGVYLVCTVPTNYPYKFIRGRRMIRIVFGEVSARYWDGEQTSPYGVYSVSGLCRSNLVKNLVYAVTGSKSDYTWLKWVLIALGIGAAGFVAFQMGLIPTAGGAEPSLIPPVSPGVVPQPSMGVE